MDPGFRLPNPEEYPAVQALDPAGDRAHEPQRNPVLDRTM
jgi:hypothetical protein